MIFTSRILQPLKVSSLLLLMIALSLSCATAFVLPDTGITTCYDADGNEIICPSPGEAYFGQDAHFGPGTLSFSDNGDGTVTDNISGFVWERKSNGDGIADPADRGDADNLYTWSEALELVAAMNASNYLNRSDWRLPTSNELDSIVDLSVDEPGPTLDLSAFPNARLGKYWTSDSDSEDPAKAWAVDFTTSSDEVFEKSQGCFVRVVRGGEGQ